MNKNAVQNQDIYLALFVVWSITAASIIVLVDHQLYYLGLALLVMVEVFTVTKIINYAALISLVIASSIYLVAYYSIYPFSVSTLMQPGLIVLILMVSAAIGVVFTNTLSRMFNRLQTDVQILTDLMQYDRETGLLRWQYVNQKMDDELARSRRYHKMFSVVMIEPANVDYDRMDDERRDEINQSIAKLIIQTCRTNVDIPFLGKAFGVILPETDADGATGFAKRLLISAAQREFLDLRIAIASFPNDAVTSEELLRNCETALRMAVSSGDTILRFDAIRLPEKSDIATPEEYAPGLPVKGTKKVQQLMESMEPEEYLLAVHDFYDMTELSQIQTMLAHIADIQNVQMLEYAEGRLLFKLKSDIALSGKQFVGFKGLNIKNVQSSGKLIEIELG